MRFWGHFKGRYNKLDLDKPTTTGYIALLLLRLSFIRQLMNSSVRMLPCPASSTLNTSIVDEPARLLILQTPSSSIVFLNPIYISNQPCNVGSHKCDESRRGHIQSRNALAKLIHMLASQLRTPRFAAVPGIEAVWISSSLVRMPPCERKPTMILGTPRRKD